MTQITLVLMVLGLAGFSGTAMAWLPLKRLPTNESPTKKSPIKMIEKSFFLVEGNLPKQKLKSNFIVDTGASDTVLFQWFVKENAIPQRVSNEEGTDSGGAEFTVSTVDIQQLLFTEAKQNFEFVYVVPSPGPFQKFGVGGILSPQSLFDGEDFLLDFKGKQLVGGENAQSAVNDRKLLAEIKTKPCSKDNFNKYVVEAEFNGTSGVFYLDSGGRGAALSPQYAKKAGLFSNKKSGRHGVGGKREVTKVENVEFQLSHIKTQLDVDIEPRGVSCPEADGKIGIDLMKNYAWFFQADRKVVKIFD